jgi:hypothetical protein
MASTVSLEKNKQGIELGEIRSFKSCITNVSLKPATLGGTTNKKHAIDKNKKSFTHKPQ